MRRSTHLPRGGRTTPGLSTSIRVSAATRALLGELLADPAHRGETLDELLHALARREVESLQRLRAIFAPGVRR